MIKLKELLEGAKEDREFREIAREVYNKMVKYLKTGGEIEIRPYYRYDYIIADIYLDDFAPEYVRDMESWEKPLKISFQSKDKETQHGSYRGSKQPNIKLFIVNFDYIIDTLGIDPESDDEYQHSDEFKEATRKNIILNLRQSSLYRKVFIHEFIHFLDDNRTDYLSFDQDYYHDPKEFNAFFQGAVGEIEERLKGDPNWLNNKISDWDGSFKMFKEWFMNKALHQGFVRNLTDDRRKRLLSRLYGFWQHLEDEDIV